MGIATGSLRALFDQGPATGHFRLRRDRGVLLAPPRVPDQGQGRPVQEDRAGQVQGRWANSPAYSFLQGPPNGGAFFVWRERTGGRKTWESWIVQRIDCDGALARRHENVRAVDRRLVGSETVRFGKAPGPASDAT